MRIFLACLLALAPLFVMGNLSASQAVAAINSAKALYKPEFESLLGSKLNAVNEWLAADAPGYGAEFTTLRSLYGDDSLNKEALAKKVLHDIKAIPISVRPDYY
ncbi:secreted protein [Melampsora americana]|nr:secreted protein [Melampsora americana]